jgi:hypothetical protein
MAVEISAAEAFVYHTQQAQAAHPPDNYPSRQHQAHEENSSHWQQQEQEPAQTQSTRLSASSSAVEQDHVQGLHSFVGRG